MSGMTWFAAQALMASARHPRDGKPLQNNTRLHRNADGVSFDVVLHNTAIVTIHPDDTYTLRTGGWHTQTTADRIRTYGPASVGNFKGEYMLYVHAKYEYRHSDGRVSDQYEHGFDHHEMRPGYHVPFEEGMRVNSEGVPVDVAMGFKVSKIVKSKGA